MKFVNLSNIITNTVTVRATTTTKNKKKDKRMTESRNKDYVNGLQDFVHKNFVIVLFVLFICSTLLFFFFVCVCVCFVNRYKHDARFEFSALFYFCTYLIERFFDVY